MQVHQIMTRKVLTIGPEASLRDVALILVEHGISGIPVCDAERRVLGVVSEGDILFKAHDPTSGPKGGPLAHLVEGTDPRALAKSRARTAGQAMTAPAITIEPGRSVAEAARLMVERGVNRLPVVTDGRLAGIVTRADIVRSYTRPDSDIEDEIRMMLLRRTPWLKRGDIDMAVERGQVALHGRLPALSDARVVERLAARVPGVVSVRSELTWSVDDSGREAMRAAGGS